jgi:excisionase family DNA binding protein
MRLLQKARATTHTTAQTAADAPVLVALKELVHEMRALRSILESQVERSRAQSNGQTAVSDAKHDPLMTPAELAALLQVDQRTLRQLRHEGSVPKAITLGRSPRWRRTAIEAWLAKGAAK